MADSRGSLRRCRPLAAAVALLALAQAAPACGLRSSSASSAARELFKAARAGNLDDLRHSIAKGADVNARDRWGETPLSVAAENGSDEVAAELLDARADPGIAGARKRTALHLAAMNGHASTVELLLSRHAKIEARDERNMTPLMLAADAGAEKAIQVLLRFHADPGAELASGATAHSFAIARGEDGAARLLELASRRSGARAPASAHAITAPQ